MKYSLVDTAWTCGCGALNAGYRETCADCNKTQSKNKSEYKVKQTKINKYNS